MDLNEALNIVEKYVGLNGLADDDYIKPPTYGQRRAIRLVTAEAIKYRALVLRAKDVLEEGED